MEPTQETSSGANNKAAQPLAGILIGAATQIGQLSKLGETATHLRQAAEVTAQGITILGQMVRFHFTKRDYSILLPILVETHSFNSQSAWIPEKKILPKLTGLNSQNLPKAIERLVNASVLDKPRYCDGMVQFRIQKNAALWTIRERTTEREFREARRQIKHVLDENQLPLAFERSSSEEGEAFREQVFQHNQEVFREKAHSLNLSESPSLKPSEENGPFPHSPTRTGEIGNEHSLKTSESPQRNVLNRTNGTNKNVSEPIAQNKQDEALAAVRDFVEAEDWGRSQRAWEVKCAESPDVILGEIRNIREGLRTGSLKVKQTRAKMLMSYVQGRLNSQRQRQRQSLGCHSLKMSETPQQDSTAEGAAIVAPKEPLVRIDWQTVREAVNNGG